MTESLESIFHNVVERFDTIDYSTVLQQAQIDLAEQHAQMFSGQQDSNGTSWAPLAGSTIRRKHQSPILVATGALRHSLVDVGASGNVHEISPRSLLFGTEVKSAIFLQEGTSKMPARPPVGMTERTLSNLCESVAQATIKELTR